MTRLPRGWSLNGHDDIGPWTGRDVGGGLETIGWTLNYLPEYTDYAEYSSGTGDAVVHIDWELEDIWAGDPVTETWAKNMVPSDLAGRTRSRAIAQARHDLLGGIAKYRRGRSSG